MSNTLERMEVDDEPNANVGQEDDDSLHSGEDSEESEFEEEDEKLIHQLEEQLDSSPLSYKLNLQVCCALSFCNAELSIVLIGARVQNAIM